MYHGLTGDNAKYNGMMVDDAAPLSAAVRKGHTKYEPMVPIKFNYVDEEGNKQQESTWQPLKTVKNSLRGKGGRNDKTIEAIEQKAEQRSQEIASKKSEAKKQIKEFDLAAKAAASGYSTSEYKALLKKNGIEIIK